MKIVKGIILLLAATVLLSVLASCTETQESSTNFIQRRMHGKPKKGFIDRLKDKAKDKLKNTKLTFSIGLGGKKEEEQEEDDKSDKKKKKNKNKNKKKKKKSDEEEEENEEDDFIGRKFRKLR